MVSAAGNFRYSELAGDKVNRWLHKHGSSDCRQAPEEVSFDKWEKSALDNGCFPASVSSR